MQYLVGRPRQQFRKIAHNSWNDATTTGAQIEVSVVRFHMIRLLTCHCLSLPLGVLLKLLYEVIQRIAPGCIGRAEAV